VRASSLNYRDLMVLKGGGRGPIKLGVVPIKPDGLTDQLGANLDGMLAEYAVLSEAALVHCRATSPSMKPRPCRALP
jgi:hypothetical protein